MAKLILISISSFFLASSVVLGSPRDDRHDHSMHQESKPRPKEVVKWKGKTHCKHTSHTTSHTHRLEFVNEETGEEFDMESPKLLETHCETGKNYRVEVVAEKSDGFLFWNGDLKVRSYKVLAELDEEVYVHKAPKSREIGSRNKR